MTPLYHRELKIQTGFAVTALCLSYKFTNLKTVSSVVKGALTALMPLELLRIAFLLRALQKNTEENRELKQRPTQEEMDTALEEIELLSAHNCQAESSMHYALSIR